MERRELLAAIVVGIAGLFLTLSLWFVIDLLARHLPVDPRFQAAIRHVHERADRQLF
jgi:hypothetical protein